MNSYIKPSFRINKFTAICLTLVTLLVSGSAFASKITESVVTIYVDTSIGSRQGTGFLISSNGLIATAYHVVQNATSVEIYRKGKRIPSEVTLIGSDPQRDLAVIKVTVDEPLPPLNVSSIAPSTGSMLYVIGPVRGLLDQVLNAKMTSPQGTESSLSIRAASGQRIFANDIEVVPLDVTIYSGMSGSPVVNSEGNALGLLSGSIQEGRGLAWAIPSKYLLNLLKRSSDGRKMSGITVWEPLTLMRANWKSPLRTYSVKLSVKQSNKLAILESIATSLSGNWSGSLKRREDVLGVTGKCELSQAEQRIVSFGEYDIENVLYIGTLTTKLQSTVEYKPDSLQRSLLISMNDSHAEILQDLIKQRDDYLREGYTDMVDKYDRLITKSRNGINETTQSLKSDLVESERKCYEKAHGPGGGSSKETVTRSEIVIEPPTTLRSRNQRVNVRLTVKSCDGDCNAEDFDYGYSGSLRAISSKTLKWEAYGETSMILESM